jgi:hypothetical protein
MIREVKSKAKGIENKVVEVKFSPGNPVKLKIGDRIELKPGTIVDIYGKKEYVLQSDLNVYKTYSYEGRTIVFRRRCLNLGAIQSFDHVTGVERYSPGHPHYRNVKKVLENSRIYPEEN